MSSPRRWRPSIGYVEEVPSDRLVYGGVEGMLKTLDPHSSFFDPRQYAQMRERQEGRYYGLGIQISADRRRHHRDVDLRGIAGLQEGPAPGRRHRPDREQGSRRQATMLDAKGMSSEDAVKLLKDPRARRSTSRSSAAATTS